MNTLKVVAVAKDMGSHSVVSPLVDKFNEEEHKVIVVAEGIAAEYFQRDGRKLAFAGTRDFRDAPFSLDCEAFLKFHKPHVVVVGEGFPDHIEGQMALAANALSIPIAAVEDYWRGAFRILPAQPDIACTVDEYSAGITRNDFPEAKVVITGNPGARMLVASPAVSEKMRSLRQAYDNTFVFVGGGEFTTDDTRLLIECLRKTHGNWCLVPAFHPKTRDRKVPESEQTFGELWNEMLAPLGERVKHVEGRGDDLVSFASTVISHRSTLTTAAAYMGKVVISIQTPAGIKSNIDQTGLSEVPHVKLGVAPLIEEPADLATFEPPDPDLVKEKIFPFNPGLAYDAILEYLS